MHLNWLYALPILLSACSDRPLSADAAPESFGAAVRHNIQAQIANPNRATKALAPASGERAALAARRYQVDRVEAPIEVYTRGE